MNYLRKLYTQIYTLNWSKAIIAGTLGMIALLLLASFFSGGKLLYHNDTHSAPCGIYIAVPSCRTDYMYDEFVIAKLPVDVEALHVKKDFLLLKKVQGLPGDHYQVTASSLLINGRTYPIYSASNLPRLADGNYIVPEGYVLLLNDPDDSFDSRYFGPVSIDNIVQHAHLLFMYDDIESLFNSFSF